MSGIRLISESTYVFLNLTDNTLDDVDESLRLDKQLKLDPHSARYGLGSLEKLPLGILHLTLLALDIRSMTEFRRVNKRARLVTGSIPQYRQILAHTPAALRGSLNLETARNFSCQALYETLSTAECDGCGDFGGYLYLLTCRRVCFLCLTEKTDYLPLVPEGCDSQIRAAGPDSSSASASHEELPGPILASRDQMSTP
ncbi:uncharacterized protein BO72DRAFT_444843 [Aspergillus fijiensis CBS 313.89]|uniref:F-box domain-containing protein n=1 Tax=Aspergillus fijiensis CBS 313.89 TaxID=1448319 RepID=A0A8G1RVG7_9EURO|nr:uncharacterized protein BO72DRAFT_444843 [Aspergillus fijiensis CBS 313.89]RAK80827.1 hypothetical protein BO72DRAFT_444843 [Aspergillus fijiensis CBS 313.89]